MILKGVLLTVLVPMVDSVCLASEARSGAVNQEKLALLSKDNFYSDIQRNVTVDVGAGLKEVLEAEKVRGSCNKHFANLDPTTGRVRDGLQDYAAAQRTMILCGKELFIWLNVPTKVAVPDVLYKALVLTFPDEAGPSFTKLGFRENPYEPGAPLELPKVDAVKNDWKGNFMGPGRNLACTGCHLGRLPDGRYSIGMPNEQLDLGKFNALMSYPLWLASHQKRDASIWEPSVDAYYRGLFNKSKGKVNFPRALLDASVLASLFGMQDTLYAFIGQDPLPVTDQRTFLKSKVGTLNPSTPMLSDPENEIYVSAPPIWKMKHVKGDLGEPYLGRITSSDSLEQFVAQAFVYSTLTSEFSVPKYIDPLTAYMRQIDAPKNPKARDEQKFEKGQELFANQCVSCHNGYEGSTKEAATTADATSPLVFDRLFRSYNPPTRQSRTALAELQKVGMFPLEQTGLKSRRLTGLWARSKLGYNGAIEGVDHLFCLSGKKRKTIDQNDPQAESMHRDLCETLDDASKIALKEYLLQAY